MHYELSSSGFSAAQTASEISNWIFLDSQSSVDLFGIAALLTDIIKANQKLNLAVNAGESSANKKAMVPGYRPAWFRNNILLHLDRSRQEIGQTEPFESVGR